MKETNEIPDWFDLTKYERCHVLTSSEWLRQLDYRQNCVWLGDYVAHQIAAGGMPQVKEIRRVGLPSLSWHNEFFKDLFVDRFYEKHGLTPGVPVQVPANEVVSYKKIDGNYRGLVRSSVWPLNLSEAHFWTDQINSVNYTEFKDFSIKVDNREDMSCYDQNVPLALIVRDSGYEHGDGQGSIFPTVIDISMPTEVILKQLKDMLPQYRELMNIKVQKKKPTPANLKLLAQRQVLAYLDLWTWELEHQVKIKRSVLVNALFPYGQIGESGLYKQVIPLAKMAISESFMTMLEDSLPHGG